MAELLVLGAALSWAVSIVALRPLTARHGALPITAVRAIAPAVAFALIVTVSGRWGEAVSMPLVNLLAILAAVVVGIGGGEMLVVRAVPRVGVSRAYALASTYPLFTALIAVTLLGETLTVMDGVGGVLIVVAGLLLAIEPAARSGAAAPGPWRLRTSVGALLALLASLLFALDLNALRLALEGLPPEIVNAVRMPLAALGLNLAALASGGRWAPVTLGRRDSLIALASGLVALTVGGYMFLSGIQVVGAARGGALTATAPVFVLLLSSVTLRERPGRYAIVGVLVSAGGVALLTLG